METRLEKTSVAIDGTQELLKLYPTGYERHDGGIIDPQWAGREIPVPPTWVRERVKVPYGCEYATLAKEIDDAYPASVRVPAVEYVRQWESWVLPRGGHLIIAGRVTRQKSDWVASAIMNEIMMRFGATAPLTTAWLGGGLLRRILDARNRKEDTYYALRRYVENATLLFVQQPYRMTANAETKAMVEDIYEAREFHRRPTITTLHTTLQGTEDWGHLRTLVGDFVADTLEYHTRPEHLAHF